MLLAGCAQTGLGACRFDSDLSGAWTIALTMPDGDGGVNDVVPRGDTIHATLEQHSTGGVLDVGRLLWGMLVSDDGGFFNVLDIPRLTHNDGSKTGAALGCNVAIQIPTAASVTDDNVPQPPNRITLVGVVVAKGQMAGDAQKSSVIMLEDGAMTPRRFAWSAARN
jgi:hypothetical protein